MKTRLRLPVFALLMAGGLGFRYLAEQVAKALPFGGDFVSGAIAGASTWAMGQVILEYYESEKHISPQRLRMLYQEFYQRYRRQQASQELGQYVYEGQEPPLQLEAPG